MRRWILTYSTLPGTRSRSMTCGLPAFSMAFSAISFTVFSELSNLIPASFTCTSISFTFVSKLFTCCSLRLMMPRGSFSYNSFSYLCRVVRRSSVSALAACGLLLIPPWDYPPFLPVPWPTAFRKPPVSAIWYFFV